MNIFRKKLSAAGTLLLITALFSFCNRPAQTPEVSVAAPQEQVAPVTPVAEVQNTADAPTGALPSELVCMVNNAYMGGKKQLPVQYENKTYYGCCNMCVNRINTDRSVRFGQDPLTRKEVDKALAYITLKPGSADEVLYFESEENAKAYLQL